MSNLPLKTIFMGTPEFAVASLESLAADSRFEIVLAITQTDKAAGRNQEIQETPIKKVAKSLGIKVMQPEKIRLAEEDIRSLAPDLIVVVAYGKIIPQSILDIPKYGCINLHGSLLPKYRGASCLSAPIINGDWKSGVTIMKMDAGMDTGPIIKQIETKLEDKETLASLHDKLSKLGADNLPDAIIGYIKGEILPKPQDDSLATYVKLTSKDDGIIDWNMPAKEIEQKIRGYYPWPGAFSYLPGGKRIKIIAADILTENGKSDKVGTITIEDNQIKVDCGQGQIVILQLQIEGGKPMDFQQFITGYSRLNGQILASSSIG